MGSEAMQCTLNADSAEKFYHFSKDDQLWCAMSRTWKDSATVHHNTEYMKNLHTT